MFSHCRKFKSNKSGFQTFDKFVIKNCEILDQKYYYNLENRDLTFLDTSWWRTNAEIMFEDTKFELTDDQCWHNGGKFRFF